jgi:hypothetical protein
MHWNVSIGPEKFLILCRFLTLFPLKRPAWREKNTSNMAATIDDVMDGVTCKCSITHASLDWCGPASPEIMLVTSLLVELTFEIRHHQMNYNHSVFS